MGLNLAQCLQGTADLLPDKAAVTFEGTRFTYSELVAAAKRVANALRARGIRPGDRVALMLGNTPHFPIAYFGILYAGGAVVALNPGLRVRELVYQLTDADVRGIVVWHECLPDAAEAVKQVASCAVVLVAEAGMRPEVPATGESFLAALLGAETEFAMENRAPEDTAVILYTSAMRGKPLGAQLTHENLLDNATIISRDVLKYYPDDVCMGVLPLFHSFGQTCMMNAAFLSQGSMVLVPRFDAHRVYEAISRDRVSLLAMVPTMFHFLNHYKREEVLDFSSVRVAIAGGAPLTEAIAGEFERRFGKPILEGYGLTETSPVVAFNRDVATNRPGTVGTAIPGTEVRIERPDGSVAGPGETGEIVIRGKNVMKGYLNAPEATAEALCGGWLHTGDLGNIDADGFIRITGLKKDMVIRAGMNVYPKEVEDCLREHPDIAEVAVIGVPDPIRGQEVKAYLVLRPGRALSDRDLGTWWRERFAAYKCPKRFETVAALPKDPSGRVLKEHLAGTGNP